MSLRNVMCFLFARTCCRIAIAATARRLQPHPLAALQAYARHLRDKRRRFTPIDGIGAFDHVHRAAFLQELRDQPALQVLHLGKNKIARVEWERGNYTNIRFLPFGAATDALKFYMARYVRFVQGTRGLEREEEVRRLEREAADKEEELRAQVDQAEGASEPREGRGHVMSPSSVRHT